MIARVRNRDRGPNFNGIVVDVLPGFSSAIVHLFHCRQHGPDILPAVGPGEHDFRSGNRNCVCGQVIRARTLNFHAARFRGVRSGSHISGGTLRRLRVNHAAIRFKQLYLYTVVRMVLVAVSPYLLHGNAGAFLAGINESFLADISDCRVQLSIRILRHIDNSGIRRCRVIVQRGVRTFYFCDGIGMLSGFPVFNGRKGERGLLTVARVPDCGGGNNGFYFVYCLRRHEPERFAALHVAADQDLGAIQRHLDALIVIEAEGSVGGEGGGSNPSVAIVRQRHHDQLVSIIDELIVGEVCQRAVDFMHAISKHLDALACERVQDRAFHVLFGKSERRELRIAAGIVVDRIADPGASLVQLEAVSIGGKRGGCIL